MQTFNVKKHDVKERVKSHREIEHLKRFCKIDYDFWCNKCEKEYRFRPGFKRQTMTTTNGSNDRP